MLFVFGTFNPQVDLIGEAQRHLQFLREVDQVSFLLHRDHVIQNAIRRYEHIWLPLVARNNHTRLHPPLDVAWVWHVHMLCPKRYAADCHEIVGQLVDHRFCDAHDATTVDAETRRLWAQFTREPFGVVYEHVSPSDAAATSRISYDILSASQRQKEFYYHVSLPHFATDAFLQNALKRYKMFVQLKRASQGSFLVPMYDIDLMWHTHQLCPVDYALDLTSYLGYVMDHDDSTTDRSTGSMLSDATGATHQLWNRAYTFEPYNQSGVMYRGINPRGSMSKVTVDEEASLFQTKHIVLVNRVTLSGNLKAKHKISCSIRARNQLNGHIFTTLPAKKGLPFDWQCTGGNRLFTFDVHASIGEILTLYFERSDGLIGAIAGKEFQKIHLHIQERDVIQALEANSGGDNSFHMSAAGRDNVRVSLDLSATPSRAGDEVLTLQEGTYVDAVMPPDDTTLWGPVPLPTLPPGVTALCSVASHSLKDHQGRTRFTARVIHSTVLRTSVVQVFYLDRLVAVSHLIGNDQLPKFEQVANSSSGCMFLDASKGERAMLVKNGRGDWGIVKGAWTGFQRPRAAFRQRGKRGKRVGNAGYLNVQFHHIGMKRTTQTDIMKDGWTTFDLPHASIRLSQDQIRLHADIEDVAENIAVAFSACVLYVLCEPRYDPPGISNKTAKIKSRGHSVPFFVAMGYTTPTPSNSWMYWHHREAHSGSQPGDPGCPEAGDGGSLEHEGPTSDESDFCPWDPDGDVGDVGGSCDGAGCGGCATGGDDGGGGSCGSSCGSSDGGGSSCGSSCGSSDGGGSSCGSSCGSGCGGGD